MYLIFINADSGIVLIFYILTIIKILLLFL